MCCPTGSMRESGEVVAIHVMQAGFQVGNKQYYSRRTVRGLLAWTPTVAFLSLHMAKVQQISPYHISVTIGVLDRLLSANLQITILCRGDCFRPAVSSWLGQKQCGLGPEVLGRL